MQTHVGGGRHSIRGSGDARATTGQQAKTIETLLSGTRDATGRPTFIWAVLSEVHGQCGTRTRMVSSYSCKSFLV